MAESDGGERATVTAEELAEIEAEAGLASAAPWRVGDNDPGYEGSVFVWSAAHGGNHHVCYLGNMEDVEAQELYDAAFIVASRQNVPRLCAALREAWRRIAELEGQKQVCPVCRGSGLVAPHFYDPGRETWGSTSAVEVAENCRACGGRGIL